MLSQYADEIESGLWLGSDFAGCLSFNELNNNNIVAVVVVGFGLETPHESKLDYLVIPADDIHGSTIMAYFETSAQFIEKQKNKGNVLVHCAQGVSRSPSIVIAYLMWKHKISRRDAEYIVRSKRKIISPKPDFLHQLDLWEILNYSLECRDNFTQQQILTYNEYSSKYKKKRKESYEIAAK